MRVYILLFLSFYCSSVANAALLQQKGRITQDSKMRIEVEVSCYQGTNCTPSRDVVSYGLSENWEYQFPLILNYQVLKDQQFSLYLGGGIDHFVYSEAETSETGDTTETGGLRYRSTFKLGGIYTLKNGASAFGKMALFGQYNEDTNLEQELIPFYADFYLSYPIHNALDGYSYFSSDKLNWKIWNPYAGLGLSFDLIPSFSVQAEIGIDSQKNENVTFSFITVF